MNEVFEIIYLIYKQESLTQRAIATALGMSLGKVNQLIELIHNDGFIVNLNGYALTDKGREYLEDNKVDNAVIMAAGLGSRFVPMTYDTPKGLLEVHGERMIERQIKQLLEVGIDDITIVVGYLKEKFEYLTDKFGVKLLYNPDYAVMNNISSIYHAQHLLKNTYIITSDIYMPENIYRKYEAYSYYCAEFFVEYTNEWALELNKKNLITAVDYKGGNNVWTMYGPAFVTKDFSVRFIQYVNHYYKKNDSAQWYWENIYIKHINDLPLYARKLEKGSVMEFECVEELRLYDRSYFVHSRSEILDLIARKFKVSQKDIINIRTLKEGMTNDSFLFEVQGHAYVFRAPGKGTDLLLNRIQEYEVYQLIKDLNISDDIVYLNSENGYKISKFIPNSRTLISTNKDEVAKAMGIIRKFHKQKLKANHEFDIEERIQFYLDLCIKEKAIFFEDFESVHELVKEVLIFVKSQKREKVLCHIDSVPSNFLFSEESVTLLDWEYSGMADPLIDVAMYVVYDGLQKDGAIDLLELYLERTSSDIEKKVLFSYIALAGFLWSLWTQYKQSQGEDFGTYGMEQYSYARKFSRYVLGKGS